MEMNNRRISEECPVCNERWGFIHEYGGDWFLAHQCRVAKAFVFWNERYTFYLHYDNRNPIERTVEEQ